VKGRDLNSGEYKLMGLAPYGKARFAQRILDNLIDLKTDGSFRLDMSYFDYCVGLTSQVKHPRISAGQRQLISALTSTGILPAIWP